MKPATIKYLYSSGGVIFRRSAGQFDVALIATKNGTVWTLPKGIIDKDESAEMAAVREIQEETGLTGSIIARLGEKSYWFYLKGENAKCKKTVAYFLLEHVSGETNNFSWEVDEAGWFPLDEAIGMLHYKSDKEILIKAKDRLAQLK